jgi:hypothetical protein
MVPVCPNEQNSGTLCEKYLGDGLYNYCNVRFGFSYGHCLSTGFLISRN